MCRPQGLFFDRGSLDEESGFHMLNKGQRYADLSHSDEKKVFCTKIIVFDTKIDIP